MLAPDESRIIDLDQRVDAITVENRASASSLDTITDLENALKADRLEVLPLLGKLFLKGLYQPQDFLKLSLGLRRYYLQIKDQPEEKGEIVHLLKLFFEEMAHTNRENFNQIIFDYYLAFAPSQIWTSSCPLSRDIPGLVLLINSDSLLTQKEKMALVGKIDAFFPKEIAKLTEVDVVCDLYIQQAAAKANKFELEDAIAILNKIPRSANRYNDARFGIAMYSRTLTSECFHEIQNNPQLAALVNKKFLEKGMAHYTSTLLQETDEDPDNQLANIAAMRLEAGQETIPLIAFDQTTNLDSLPDQIQDVDPTIIKLRKKAGNAFFKVTSYFGGISGLVSTSVISGSSLFFRGAEKFDKNLLFFEHKSWCDFQGECGPCFFDDSIERHQPTSSRASVLPSAIFGLINTMPLTMAFLFAKKFGITKEKKYLALAIASLALALGGFFVEEQINNHLEENSGKVNGYNLRWVGCKMTICKDSPDCDFPNEELYDIASEINNKLYELDLNGIPKPFLASFEGLFLIFGLSALVVFLGFTAGLFSQKLEITTSNETKTYAM